MFDLTKIRSELAGMPPEGPYAWELAIAVISDVLRDGGVAAPATADWRALAGRGNKGEGRKEQLGALARILAVTSLGAGTAEALRARPPADAMAMLEGFLEAIWPLTAELIGGNAFRQEELLRRWIAGAGGAIAGEEAAESARRLDQLDYRKTLSEMEKAEKSRLTEAAKRAEALRKAREEAEEAARGWRE